VSGTQLTDRVPWGEGTFGDALLAPTVLYVRPVLKLLQQLPVKVSKLQKTLFLHAAKYDKLPCLGFGIGTGSLDPPASASRHSSSQFSVLAEPEKPTLGRLQGLIHMTGGGFPENIPRVVPKGLQTRVDCSAWDIPELFKWLQQVPELPASP